MVGGRNATNNLVMFSFALETNTVQVITKKVTVIDPLQKWLPLNFSFVHI